PWGGWWGMARARWSFALATAKPDGSEPLQQRLARLFGRCCRLGLARAELVLRRQRQFIDARHARRPHRLRGLRRNERLLRLGELRRGLGRRLDRVAEQRGLRGDRPDR